MNNPPKHWLDTLTDGQWVRDWTSLNANFIFGLFYWTTLIILFSLGLSLAVVIIGIPLLLLAFHSMRTLAALDHQVTAALLDRPPRTIEEDLDLEGTGLLERMRRVLGSARTWRSLIYLALKLPLGALTASVAWMLLPFMAFEALILGPLTINTGMVTFHLLHALAVFSHEGTAMLLPEEQERPIREKGKRDLRVERLEAIEEYDDEPSGRYVLTDDGEIEFKRRY
jgi:hypothetical protein